MGTAPGIPIPRLASLWTPLSSTSADAALADTAEERAAKSRRIEDALQVMKEALWQAEAVGPPARVRKEAVGGRRWTVEGVEREKERLQEQLRRLGASPLRNGNEDGC